MPKDNLPKVIFKSCSKCGGDLTLEEEISNLSVYRFYSCMQCGHQPSNKSVVEVLKNLYAKV